MTLRSKHRWRLVEWGPMGGSRICNRCFRRKKLFRNGPCLLVTLVALALAAPAEAHLPHLERATAVAEARFPLACVVGVGQAPLPPGISAEADVEGCGITFPSAGRWHVHRWGFVQFCTVLVHEYGHLVGLDHSPNPRHIMYAGDQPAGYWRCRKAHRS